MACAPARKPLVEARFDPAGVRVIGVAPILDVRPDRFERVLATVHAREAALEALARKGYRVEPVAMPEAVRKVRAGSGEAPTPEWLAEAFADTADYVFLVMLEDFDPGGGRVGEARATVSAFLLDTRGRRVLWSDRATARASLGGLFAALTGPATGYEAAYEAVRAVVRTLPPTSAAKVTRRFRRAR